MRHPSSNILPATESLNHHIYHLTFNPCDTRKEDSISRRCRVKVLYCIIHFSGVICGGVVCYPWPSPPFTPLSLSAREVFTTQQQHTGPQFLFTTTGNLHLFTPTTLMWKMHLWQPGLGICLEVEIFIVVQRRCTDTQAEASSSSEWNKAEHSTTSW